MSQDASDALGNCVAFYDCAFTRSCRMGDGADSAEETDLVRYAVAAPMPAGAEAPPAPIVKFYVRNSDIIKYGMTAGCQGCAAPRRGCATAHSLRCRARIMSEVERDGGRMPRRTLKTVAIYPVVPNSPALPRWVQSVHASHQVILVGGVAGCLRCGWIVVQMRYVLKKPCDGRFRASKACLLYTSPSPRDRQKSRMPSSA